MAMKIYCNAECEYNKGCCRHPENLNMGCYGGIDRCYVEKCDLYDAVEYKGYRFGRGNNKIYTSFEKFFKFVLKNKGGE